MTVSTGKRAHVRRLVVTGEPWRREALCQAFGSSRRINDGKRVRDG